MLDTEMTGDVPARDTLPSASALDAETVSLVRLSGVICAGTEPQMRDALARAAGDCRPEWVEEVVLQSYLFAGFPRALNAAREWRRISGRRAPATDEGEEFGNATRWRTDGEKTCATVYGRFYERLRHNIRELTVHAAYWKYAVRRRLTGATRGAFALTGSNWFDIPPDRAWTDDLRLLADEHRQLREAIAAYPARALSKPIDREHLQACLQRHLSEPMADSA